MFKKKDKFKQHHTYGLSELVPPASDTPIRKDNILSKKAKPDLTVGHKHHASSSAKSLPKSPNDKNLKKFLKNPESLQPTKAPCTPSYNPAKKVLTQPHSSKSTKDHRHPQLVFDKKKPLPHHSPQQHREGHATSRGARESAEKISSPTTNPGPVKSARSVDLFDHYEGLLSISHKFDSKSSKKQPTSSSKSNIQPTTPINPSKSIALSTYQQQPKREEPEETVSINNNPTHQSASLPLSHYLRSTSATAEYSKSQVGIDEEFLMCDQELDMRKPPLYFADSNNNNNSNRNKVFTHHRSSSSAASNYTLFDKYCSNDLAVVEQRIISQEEREIVSPSNSMGSGSYNSKNPLNGLFLSNKENLLHTANTAASQKQMLTSARNVSPFDGKDTNSKKSQAQQQTNERQPSKKKVININVGNLLAGKTGKGCTPGKTKVVLKKERLL